MSRIGNLAIQIPEKVEAKLNGNTITIKGQKGELVKEIPDLLNVEISDSKIFVTKKSENRQSRSLHGLFRSLINNMVIGVDQLFSKTLELKGVGYKGSANKTALTLNLGYSHPISLPTPNGIEVSVENNTVIHVKGIDKEQVGLFAQEIRSKRPPEPYKGKGVLYKGETIIRKVGKSSK